MYWPTVQLDLKPSSSIKTSIINLPLKEDSLKDYSEITREINDWERWNKPNKKLTVSELPDGSVLFLSTY